jgi:glycoside hydrolase family 18
MKKMLLLLVCLTTFAWLHAEDVTVNLNLADPTTLVNKDGSLGTPASGKGLDYDYFGKDDVWVSVDFGTVTNKDSHLRFYGSNPITWRCSQNGGTAGQKFTISAPGNITKIEFTGTLAVTASPTGLSGKIWTGNSESVTFKTTAANTLSAIAVTYTKVDETKVAAPTFSHESGEVEAGTKVEIDCKTADAKIYYTTDETDPTETSTLYDASTGIIVNEAMTIKAIAVKEGLEDSAIASATYTIKKPVVDTPIFDPAPGAVDKGTEVTISCATEGATLMYQVNGGELLEGESGVIVVINEATTIEVIASKDGYVASEATAKYTIIGEIEAAPQAFFDFTKPEDLGLTAKKDTPISGKAITVNGISVTFSKGTSTDAKVWENNGYHIRVYQGATITVSAGEGQSIESIQFKGATLFRIQYNGTAIAKSGETTVNWWNPTLNQRAATNEVQFTVDDSGRVDINSINVNDPVVTGVEDVTVDENAPVEYYNLQGVRVANPENGIYIRRQGSKVSKVLVK